MSDSVLCTLYVRLRAWSRLTGLLFIVPTARVVHESYLEQFRLRERGMVCVRTLVLTGFASRRVTHTRVYKVRGHPQVSVRTHWGPSRPFSTGVQGLDTDVCDPHTLLSRGTWEFRNSGVFVSESPGDCIVHYRLVEVSDPDF